MFGIERHIPTSQREVQEELQRKDLEEAGVLVLWAGPGLSTLNEDRSHHFVCTFFTGMSLF